MHEPPEAHWNRAVALHREAVVIDTHCDTTQRLLDPNWDITRRDALGHVDLPRLREGGVDGVFFAVFAPAFDAPGEGVAQATRQLDALDAMIAKRPEFVPVRRAADVRQARSAGKVAVAVGVEGGHLIEDSLEVLRRYRHRGAAYLTLTHAFHTNWADSSGVHEAIEPRHGGLSAFGRDVIRELNRLGMIVDVSHAADQTVRDVLEVSSAPVIASHSSCRTVAPHRRNLPDELIRAIAATGGTVQINFAMHFIDPAAPPLTGDALQRWIDAGGVLREPVTDHVTPLSILVDHFDHALRLVGPAHVGVGSDFDGVPALPTEMEHCGRLPAVTAALLARGYSEAELEPMLGANVLHVMEACAAQAADA